MIGEGGVRPRAGFARLAPLGVTAAAEVSIRTRWPAPFRRMGLEWAYVNVDVGDGGAFAYDSRKPGQAPRPPGTRAASAAGPRRNLVHLVVVLQRPGRLLLLRELGPSRINHTIDVTAQSSLSSAPSAPWTAASSSSASSVGWGLSHSWPLSRTCDAFERPPSTVVVQGRQTPHHPAASQHDQSGSSCACASRVGASGDAAARQGRRTHESARPES